MSALKKNVFAGLFLVWGLAFTQAQVKLQFDPEKRATYEYQTEMVQTVRQTVMGQDVPVETELNMTYLMEVEDKTRQETSVKFTYRDIVHIVSSPMLKMRYDSKNPVENPSDMDKTLDRLYGTIIGKSFQAVIASDGSVKSITGLDDMVEDMIRSIGDGGQLAAQTSASLKQMFSDAAIRNMFQQSFKIYPADAVKPGDSWDSEAAPLVSNNMTIGIKTVYTLKEIRKNTAVIALESTVDISPGAGAEGKLTGTQSGTITIDSKTGIPALNETAQNVKGSFKMQGMEISMEWNAKIKNTIQKIK